MPHPAAYTYFPHSLPLSGPALGLKTASFGDEVFDGESFGPAEFRWNSRGGESGARSGRGGDVFFLVPSGGGVRGFDGCLAENVAGLGCPERVTCFAGRGET